MKYLSLYILLITAAASAQPPVIDSMLISESKNELSVYGDFGALKGAVWCDTVELAIISWSDSLVVATIPATGKGSTGPVVVGGRGYQSEARMLSMWSGSTGRMYAESRRGSHGYSFDFKFSFRMDLHSILRGNKDIRRVFEPCYTSIYEVSETDMHPNSFGPPTGYSVEATLNMRDDLAKYSDGFHANVYFGASTMGLYFFIDKTKGVIRYDFDGGSYPKATPYDAPGLGANSSLDSQARLIPWSVITDNGISDFGERYFRVGATKFLPPAKAIALNDRPLIIAPADGSVGIKTDLVLEWDSMHYMDSYHIQVSTDSIVNGQAACQSPQSQPFILDTVVSGSSCQLARLNTNVKYYWRIAGLNSEGKSRWSAIHRFTTGIKGHAEQNDPQAVRFSVYPNPFMNETKLQFSLSEPSEVSLSIYDMFGRKVWSIPTSHYDVGSHEISYRADQLPSGHYIVRLNTANGERSAILIKV